MKFLVATRTRIIGLVVVVLLLVAFILTRTQEARSISLLLRFGGGEGALAHLRESEVIEEELLIPTAGKPIRARLYTPQGRALSEIGGVVLAHGVHHLGIEEPRLRRFARAISSAGIAVLTPEIAELADYRIERASVATIVRSAEVLAQRVQRKQVGVMGFSFAGGLAMLAAGDAATNRAIAFVVSIGGYDDLERVLTFFVENKIAKPTGEEVMLSAHPYGPIVLVYGHLDLFFAPDDISVAEHAIRAWLYEKRDQAREYATHASPAGQERLAVLFSEHTGVLAPEIRKAIADHRELIREVSPRGHLADLHVPVFLLHGEHDAVIPATETLWLAQDSGAHLREFLVTGAVEHVELEKTSTYGERWKLVEFMSDVLSETEAEPR